MKRKIYFEIAAFIAAGSIANYADFIQASAAESIEKCVVVGQSVNLASDGHGVILDLLRRDGNVYQIEIDDAWDLFALDVVEIKFDDMQTGSPLDDIAAYYGPTSEWIHPDDLSSWIIK